MDNYIVGVLKDLLTLIYQYLGISAICTTLFMIVKKQAEHVGWRKLYSDFVQQMKEKKEKYQFFFVLYIIFVMQRTLFNREPWGNPLSNVLGVWKIVENGVANYEMFENILMFVPLIPLLEISQFDKMIKYWDLTRLLKTVEKCFVISVFLQSIIISFEISFLIECLQLMFRVGTFQLSDLCYNTIGGLIGGFIYWCGYKITHRNKKGQSYGV